MCTKHKPTNLNQSKQKRRNWTWRTIMWRLCTTPSNRDLQLLLRLNRKEVALCAIQHKICRKPNNSSSNSSNSSSNSNKLFKNQRILIDLQALYRMSDHRKRKLRRCPEVLAQHVRSKSIWIWYQQRRRRWDRMSWSVAVNVKHTQSKRSPLKPRQVIWQPNNFSRKIRNRSSRTKTFAIV